MILMINIECVPIQHYPGGLCNEDVPYFPYSRKLIVEYYSDEINVNIYMPQTAVTLDSSTVSHSCHH
jgi:hypothetical protein